MAERGSALRSPSPRMLSERLLQRRHEAAPLLRQAVLELAASASPKEALKQYLVQLYHYVRESCPLMELAAGGLDRNGAIFRSYLDRHTKEERGHERWVLGDLERLGVPRSLVRQSLPHVATMEMVGTQLYIINRVNPIAFLGYIFALESSPPTRASVDVLSQLFDVPASALTVLSRHAETDPKHLNELCEVVDHSSIDKTTARLIEVNVQITVRSLLHVIRACARPNPGLAQVSQSCEDRPLVHL